MLRVNSPTLDRIPSPQPLGTMGVCGWAGEAKAKAKGVGALDPPALSRATLLLRASVVLKSHWLRLVLTAICLQVKVKQFRALGIGTI